VSLGNGRTGSQRTTALVVLAFGVVVCVIGVIFIATNHDLRAAASFIVGVVAIAAAWFLLRKKPSTG
jgi:uncharacterized membrane protein HdeD (DUF308 family)